MAQLDKDSLKHLTRLCRIDLSEAEQEKLLLDLKSILAYVEQLGEVDTAGVSPCNHVLEGMQNVMREDAVKEPLPRQEFLSNAPDQIGGMIRVPSVIKKKQ